MKFSKKCLAALVFLATGTGASAALVESVTVSNRYGYNFIGSAGVDVNDGGPRETVFSGLRYPSLASDLVIDYVGEAAKGSFFFLHDNYCVGACSTSSGTTITFTVTNSGDTPVDLRFDSLITPGHLARIDGDAPGRGGFDFSVVQRTDGLLDRSLYAASGTVNDAELSVATSLGTPFDGQLEYVLPGGRVLDWSSTPLNLELGSLAAGATTQVIYSASYFVTASNECVQIQPCGGLQVVFGDPRNNGSVRTLARALDAAAIGDPVEIINREYDAFNVPYAFNLSGSPFPDLPPGQGPVTYEGLYDPSDTAVPEPATWVSLILGMALLGAALRRSRRRESNGCKSSLGVALPARA